MYKFVGKEKPSEEGNREAYSTEEKIDKKIRTVMTKEIRRRKEKRLGV